MSQRAPPPPTPDFILAGVWRITEALVDGVANMAYGLVQKSPQFATLSESERKALAYALAGDLLASPVPPPFDTPLDTIVQERVRSLIPDMDKYLRMTARVAEAVPVLELLPNYTLAVLATIRERGMR